MSSDVMNYVAEPLNVLEYTHLPLMHIFTPFSLRPISIYSWNDAFIPNVMPVAKRNMVCWGEMKHLWDKVEHGDTGQNGLV